MVSLGVGRRVINSLFKFQDQDGRILVLRPEMTISTCRAIAPTLKGNKDLPKRIFYIANAFRYISSGVYQDREFWQVGAELLGVPAIQGELEVISVLHDMLTSVGLKNFQIWIGHIEIFKTFCKELDITDPQIMDQLKEVLWRRDENALSLLLRKYGYSDRIDDFRDFMKLRGNTEKLVDVLKQSRIVSDNMRKYIKLLFNLLKGLKENYSINANYDLSLIRDLEYYTGFIFEVYVRGLGYFIASGGRYDNLMRAFCDFDIPAIGFAINIDHCENILRSQAQITAKNPKKIVVHLREKNLLPDAKKLVNKLRIKYQVIFLPRDVSKNDVDTYYRGKEDFVVYELKNKGDISRIMEDLS